MRCPTCSYVAVLRKSTPELERYRRLELRMKARARSLQRRNGAVDTTTRAWLRKIRWEIKRIENEIAK